ncbi:hypothetical protein ACS0TY_022126 [Phlomoides rotata]
MRKSDIDEEPCMYTGGLFTESQAKAWHINEKEFFAVCQHLFWQALERPLLKVGSPSVTIKERVQQIEPQQVFQVPEPGKADSAYISPSSKEKVLQAEPPQDVQVVEPGKTNSIDTSSSYKKEETEHQASKPDVSGQPSTSGVKEGEISLRPQKGPKRVDTNVVFNNTWEKLLKGLEFRPKYFITDVSGKYPRLWALKGAHPIEVRRWYGFGTLASLCTVAPGFWEILELPDWVLNAVIESWHNNPHLKRGDELEIKFITVASEDTTNMIQYPSVHFMKLQRPDKKAFTCIKKQDTKPELVVNLTEDEISTRRAWGVWVYLTEMDKVKYPSTTRFANDMFEQKRAMIWENKLIGTENTRRKACNMMHVRRWHEQICKFCVTQEKPMFRRNFLVKKDRAGKMTEERRVQVF